MPDAKFRIFPGRIWVMTNKSSKLFSKIFGIDSYSPVLVREKDIDKIKAASLQLTKKWRCGSFAVRSRRTDKSFPLNSRQIENDVGKIIDFPCDLSNPKNTLYIEIRDHAYLYDKILRGPGGLPLGTGGRAACMLRDKDDLLAAWLVAKRGVIPIPIKPKQSLLKDLQSWCIGRRLKIVKNTAESKKLRSIALVDCKLIKNSVNGLLLLNPLVGFSEKEKKALLKSL
jgi:adenylyl- and sulfurtransferase ThiI